MDYLDLLADYGKIAQSILNPGEDEIKEEPREIKPPFEKLKFQIETIASKKVQVLSESIKSIDQELKEKDSFINKNWGDPQLRHQGLEEYKQLKRKRDKMEVEMTSLQNGAPNLRYAYYSEEYAKSNGYGFCRLFEDKKLVKVTHVTELNEEPKVPEIQDFVFVGVVEEMTIHEHGHHHVFGKKNCDQCKYKQTFGVRLEDDETTTKLVERQNRAIKKYKKRAS